MYGIFVNALKTLSRQSGTEDNGFAFQAIQVIKPYRQKVGKAAEIYRIHQGIDPVEGKAFDHPPKEGFRGRTDLGRVNTDGMVQPAGWLDSGNIAYRFIPVAGCQFIAERLENRPKRGAVVNLQAFSDNRGQADFFLQALTYLDVRF
jgi:hypothetical protein